jgi:hypothetical protein
MTEAEWRSCADPKPMLEHVAGTLGDRKWILFAVACCRGLERRWPIRTAPGLYELAERLADGLAARDDLREPLRAAARDRQRMLTSAGVEGAALLAEATGLGPARRTPATRHKALVAALKKVQSRIASTAEGPRTFLSFEHALQKEKAREAALLRCLLGNPFRPAPRSPETAPWKAGAVVPLATAIYGEYAFDRLPILADALEEAGCTDAEALAHCRGPGRHARGCWVVDRVLGKG